MHFGALFALSVLVLTVSCAKSQGAGDGSTPYQPREPVAEQWGGFTDFSTPAGHFVMFEGNSRTPRGRVIQFWHRRAGEICPSGYEILSEKTGEETLVEVGPANCIGPICQSREPYTKIVPRMEGYIRCRTGVLPGP